MGIHILNDTMDEIIIDFDSKSNILKPREKVKIECNDISEISIKSLDKKNDDKNKIYYHINIESLYKYTNIENNENFIIRYQEDKINHNTFYEKYILESSNAQCCGINYKVTNKSDIINKAKKEQRKDFFFSTLIINGSILDLILAIVLYIKFGLKAALIGGLTLYLLIFLFSIIGDKLGELFNKKILNVKSDKEELVDLMKEENIAEFYLKVKTM